MNLSFRYTAQDWTQGYMTYVIHGRRRWMRRLYIFLGCFFILMGVAVVATQKNPLASALPLFFLGLAWLYLGTALWKRAGRRAFAGRPELQQDLSVNIDDSGVDFSGPISSWHWTWQAFVRVLESKTTILLMLSPCAFAIFPKRVFGPGELKKFREIVRQKLPLK